jgi:hypothetical protein
MNKIKKTTMLGLALLANSWAQFEDAKPIATEGVTFGKLIAYSITGVVLLGVMSLLTTRLVSKGNESNKLEVIGTVGLIIFVVMAMIWLANYVFKTGGI